ncbi:CRISPR-associated protein Cas2 [Clostridium beijerinckii]|uniref:CRISPR-associated endonuclease Cas2 n=1 Tax=Clostridium beijerinckii TaxID=1520 RepID=UPI0015706D91|nr:CRISPR-associated protein Cas2 [Clostridium beijerinckii]NRT44513.1 CRISPR-associated protein Cas2 [Clostridium beijerinckii]NRZ21495.1 CRISPR-associated protein Cas2 [Clostridium beijerinckii]
MFVIITYDVNEKRVNRVRKVLKKYITWCQNSVFEGEITEGKLTKCMAEVGKYLITSEDSLYIYRIPYSKNIKKDVIGIEKISDDLFI